ncbi:MAG: YigZ family protein [Thermosipho sp. (in: Bacteria)]|nr:YigZ family protein [Thermosipho sp. (in: thermotogales)]
MMSYKTIFGTFENKININRSIFISTITHVESVEKAREFIKEISKKYNDATHNCPAYRVLENNKIIEFSSDAGEPSGTAGRPILGVLKKYDLSNVVVVVTRYFGGVKLGVRGLIDAYSKSVEQLIEKLKIIKMIPIPYYKIKLNYSEYGKTMQELHYKGFNILNTSFDNEYAYIELIGEGELQGYEIIEKTIKYIKEAT